MSSLGPSPRPRAKLGSMRRKLLPLLITAALSSQAQAADLLTITRDALENNAELASSRSIYSSVEAARDAERGDLLPQIGATADIMHNEAIESQSRPGSGTIPPGSTTAGSDRYRTTSVGVSASQALFDATNWHQLQRANEEITQQQMVFEADRQQLFNDVATAYFEILRARDVLTARESQETAINRQLEQAQEQFEVGLIAITDVHEAQAAADLARAQRISAESDLQVSFEALERLTGQRYESIDGLSEELPIEAPQPTSRDNWVTMAIENSPLVRAAEAAVRVSRADVDVSRAGHLPTLHAEAGYSYADNDIDGVEGHDEVAQIGLSATLPIFTGGRTSAQVNQMTYLLESTQYDFEAQRRDTVQQVRSLYTQVSNDVQTVAAQRQAIVSNRSALEATRSGYEVGTRNIVDVLNAEQSLYNALANYAEARYTYVTDMIALRRQAGVLDTDSIQALNEWLLEEDAVHLELPENYDSGELTNIGARPQPPQQ